MLASIWPLALALAALSPTIADDPDPALLRKLASRCGSEVDWCETWEQAAKRAAAEHRPVLVLVHSLPGFDIPDASMIGPFMDEDVIELTRECFVPLRFSKEMTAPFVAQDVYGMGPYTFGTSILVATPDGKIVADTFTLESSSLYDFLAAEVAPATPPSGLAGLPLAAWHARRGALAAATDDLKGLATAPAEQLRATILRRQRKAKDALEALARARRAGGADAAVLALSEAGLLVRLDRLDDAMAAAATVPATHAGAAAATFVTGALLLERDHDAGVKAWQGLVQAHPESRFAWLAAAYLGAGSILLGNLGGHGWPAADVLATLQRRKSAVLPPSAASQAEHTALAFLLAEQRRDGSWISPEEVMSSGSTLGDPFVIAITALCARALLPFLDEPGVDDAVLRSLAYVRASRKQPEAEPVVMDYSVWSKPCVLLFLASAIEAGAAEAEEWRPVMAALVTELAPKQKGGGGFSYYLGGDPEHLDPALDVSFSFVTAFVLVALAATKDAGVEVPEAMISKAVKCLARMQNRDGTFEYSLVHANETAPRSPTPAGSAGRGPLCSVALRLFDKTDMDGVRLALDQFLTHRQTYLKEHGKTLMHCGLEGQGSHYLMFDYAFAASAIALLPASEQSQYRTPLLAQVLASRTEVGSYLDNPILGSHYATGMALWAFAQLREKP